MSATKKLLNSVDSAVDSAVEGLLLSNPTLARICDIPNVVCRRDVEIMKKDFVTLISGGGSGHEPAHAGFIGDAMLTAAVLGNVFASPSVAQILAAIRVCAGRRGVLLIIKNYTGDRLNFGMAMEKARSEGYLVEMVVVADDAALPEGKGITGGRGVAGTCFVHKVAGAAAASGCSLAEVLKEAQECADVVRTLGVALTTCTVPGAPPSDRLVDDSIYEVGLGIHGEPGREQRSLVPGKMASIVAETLVQEIIQRLPINESSGKCALLLNNLGSLPLLEMLVVAKNVIRHAEQKGLKPVRCYIGSFMTSLEMSGISLSILPICDSLVCARLDTIVTAPAWQNMKPLRIEDGVVATASIDYSHSASSRPEGGPQVGTTISSIVRAVCESLISLEPELTRCDTICGDGDCGLVMKKGAQRILADCPGYPADSAGFCASLADSISVSMGGTSGALFELFFRAAANTLSSLKGGDDFVAAVLALQAGTKSMQFYGGASVGMRTMLDALIPAVKQMANFKPAASIQERINESAIAARRGSDSTKFMEAEAGRSNYVNKSLMSGTADPGSIAVAAAFEAAAKVC